MLFRSWPSSSFLIGQPIEKVINREAMANPGCLEWYLQFARNMGANPA